MTIRVYNTLTKTKEPFEPATPGKVGIYLCGPTVYDKAHIGHMVGPVVFDTIKRYLVYSGYDVTWVVNITDVDDKLIRKADERGISMMEVAEENTADYLANLEGLGVDQIDHMPKATENIDEIVSFIERLIERDFAYESDGDVFFDVGKDLDYGKLSNRSADSQQGEGGEAAAKKRSSGDFALWKAAKADEPSWDSPWGKGRPGWHIECSAMSRRLLGETFDIHGGGLDLVFPHHENEIAQSECCHSKPMVKYWMHNGLLRAAAAGKIGGRAEREQEQATTETKMSRSKGAGGLADLIARRGGEAIRFLLLRTHYRSTIAFGEDGIDEAGVALETFHRFAERYERITGESFYELTPIARRADGEFDPAGDSLLEEVAKRRTSYLVKMDDDFNTGGAVSDVFELVRALNKFVDQAGLEDAAARDETNLASFRRGTAALRELTAPLGVLRRPPETKVSGDNELIGKLLDLLVELRTESRANKDFATADRIRDSLDELGVTIEDRKEGTLWRLQ
ncbi:MAG: cysteine--tRNA ligase [Planctomycetes bacterium]|nr:cysteine--tRNA ligase [Planctomycetota bacterium]